MKLMIRLVSFTSLFLMMFLAACTTTPTPESTMPPVIAEPTITQMDPIPTSEPASIVWISLGGSMPQTQMQELVLQTQSLAQQSGLQMEQIPAVSMNDLEINTSRIRTVVALPPDPGLEDMARRFPEIDFISVGISNLPEIPNLYRVGAEGSRPEWDGFLAGYLAAIIAPEWRIGILTQSGSEEGERAWQGFNNGGILYCGLCNPQYPPYTDYPFRLDLSAGSNASEWMPIVDQFIKSGVKVAYIYPGVAQPEIMSYLAANGLLLIGSTPPDDDVKPSWIATIQTDLASPFNLAWQDQISEKSPSTYPTRPKIISEYTGYVSEGKLLLLESVINDLMTGVIDPLTVQ